MDLCVVVCCLSSGVSYVNIQITLMQKRISNNFLYIINCTFCFIILYVVIYKNNEEICDVKISVKRTTSCYFITKMWREDARVTIRLRIVSVYRISIFEVLIIKHFTISPTFIF